MNYCLPVFGNVLGMEKYKEGNSRHQSYTAKDNQKLQVLQNNLNRILLKAKYDTPTEVLLKETNSLSVQQMIAYHTALLAYKIVKKNRPSYLAEKLQRRNVGVSLRDNQGSIVQRNKKLALSKEGFVYRGAALLNKLSVELRNEDKLEVFKAGLRKWVLVNIPAKPVIKSKKFEERCVPKDRNHPPTYEQNDIRRFLIDRSETTGSAVPPREVPPTDRPPPSSYQHLPPVNPVVPRGILRYFTPAHMVLHSQEDIRDLSPNNE